MQLRPRVATAGAQIGIREALRQGRFRLVAAEDRKRPPMRAGDVITIDPVRIATPGDSILATCHFEEPKSESLSVLMQMNGDGDLTDENAGYVPRGQYAILGVVIDIEPVPEPIERGAL